MADASPVSLAVRNIRKSFAGVVVLDDISCDIRAGEVHTIMGENGAGKSTLMKIIGGVHLPDAGEVLIDAAPVRLSSPHVAQRHGIALIHQEPLSFPDLSVAENIFIGRGVPRGALGQVDWRSMYEQSRRLSDSLGVSLDPRAKVRELSIADRQMVELAAALSQKARILLMDEPTASLTPREVERLFALIRRMRDRGAAIVFISHRLPEVFEISDRITVLCDGRLTGSRLTVQTSPDEIIRLMVGRALGAMFERPGVAPGESLLEVRGLTQRGRFSDISFDVRAGEIVGLAGLVGAGRTEVARAVFGLTRADAGSVKVAGKAVSIRSPRDAVCAGLAYVPEDRQAHGLLLPMSVAANTSMARLRSVSKLGWLSPSREVAVATRWKDIFKTRLRDVRQPARELSGGNQQKVVLSKWLQTDPRVLILDEPTRGIDVGAKAEVHHHMAELARQGKAVLMISSDLPEVLAMSDRVLVMREGRLTAHLTRSEATQERVMAAATGTSCPSPGTPGEGRGEGLRANSPSPQPSPGVPGEGVMGSFREVGIALFVVLAYVATGIANPQFFSWDTLRSILLYTPLILIVAMGQMMAIVSRNIDLSVGSILGFCAIVVGNIFITRPGFSLTAAAVVAVAIGALLGAVNGGLIAYLRVPAIITTLGTLTAYRGLTYVYSGGKQVPSNDIPARLVELSQTSPIGIPWIVIYAAAIAVVAWLFLRYTRAGREVYAIGSNPGAAVLRGIPVRGRVLMIFTITGALSGLAGLLYASRFGYINPRDTGNGFELVVISAAIIGGVSVLGGSGTVLGVVLGCLVLGVVNTALPMLNVSAFWQTAVYGIAIVVAASVDTLLQRRRRG